jgi:hypothetical protein
VATIRGDWKDSGEQRDPAPSARTRAASEQQPDAQAAGGSKIEKERQRKERQRQRRMEEALRTMLCGRKNSLHCIPHRVAVASAC